MSTDNIEDIAIVGIGCRFPGADNIEEFWRVLLNGENHVKDIPPDRWDNSKFCSDNPDEPGKIYVQKAGLLTDHTKWDNRLFGISDHEAVRIDPQQRYVLECTHMAMEDGGFTRKQMSGSKTGVFIGVMNDDYKGLVGTDHKEDTNFTATGLSTTVIASRLSYVYNLQGPCMTVDTACSSAIMTLHLGCQAIRSGSDKRTPWLLIRLRGCAGTSGSMLVVNAESSTFSRGAAQLYLDNPSVNNCTIKYGDCDMAICGGVSSILSPDMFIPLCKARMLSRIGQCQTFCDTADGYARGEGCGIVILQSLKKTSKKRNNIWGIIQTGINQDGRVATPMTAPSSEQQQQLLHAVYKKYQIHPRDLQYIEVHGTGTPAGDPTEVNAFASFINSSSCFTSNTMDSKYDKKILMGSVKTNIGHTESAAAMAGLIKVLLMMRHGQFVKSLHINKNLSNLNRKVRLDNTALDIAVNVENWPPNTLGYRVACVNSFGFGGSNGHAIVQRIPDSGCSIKENSTECLPYFVCPSGRDRKALLGNIIHFINDVDDFSAELCDISHTSIFHRDHFERQILLFGKTTKEVKLHAEMKRKSFETIIFGQKLNIVMVFCGVGTTWIGMGSEMIKTQPVFRRTVQKIEEYLLSYSNLSVEEKLKGSADLQDPFLNHIAIFTIQVALFELWRSLGVLPHAIVGQSVGEVAAAYASGALNLSSAVKVIFYRSKLLAGQTGGKMTVVGNVRLTEIEKACLKYPGSLNIAVYNSPLSCTLSGTSTAIENMEKDVNTYSGSFIRPLNVKCAYHSHFMDSCLTEIASTLTGIGTGSGQRISHISTVTGKETDSDEFASGDYWAQNVRKPVLLMQAVEKSVTTEATNVFIEIGPRQVLKLHLPNILNEYYNTVCLPSMNLGNSECFYMSLSTLFEMGVDVEIGKPVPCKGQLSSLPKYHFCKTTELFMPTLTKQYLSGLLKSIGDQGFVRHMSDDKFTVTLSKETSPFVYEHILLGSVIVPGATYVEAAVQGALDVLDLHQNDIEISSSFEYPCVIEKDITTVLSLSFEHNKNDTDQCLQYKLTQDTRTLCSGFIFRQKLKEYPVIDINSLKRRLTQSMSSDEIYTNLEKIGLQYGESLRVIQKCYKGESSCLSVIKLSKRTQMSSSHFCIHPIVVDAMFQSSSLLSTGVSDSAAPDRAFEGIPKGFRSLKFDMATQETMLIYTKLVRETRISSFYKVILCTPVGNPIAEINDLEMRSTKSVLPNDNISYELQWRQLEDIQHIEQEREVDSQSLVILGSRRFLSWLSQSTYFLNMYKLELPEELEVLTEIIRKSLLTSRVGHRIIFAPCYNCNDIGKKDTMQIYEMVKTNLLQLQAIFKVTQSLSNNSCSISIVTEKCQRLSDSESSNFLGAELWGFARSAMTEMPFEDIRLVDIELEVENFDAFFSLLMSTKTKFTETLIRKCSIYTSKIGLSPTQDIACIEADLKEISESLTLLSESTKSILKPFLTYKKHDSRSNERTKQLTSGNMVNILVSVIHVKSYQLFQNESPFGPTHKLDLDCSPVPVNAHEFFGWITRDINNACVVDQTYGACFPVQVSTLVTVPRCCIFSLKDIPFYMPGLLSEVVLLWRVSSLIKSKSNVLIVVCDKRSWKADILLDILLYQNSKGMIASWSELNSIEIERKGFTHVVVVQVENAHNMCTLDKIKKIRRVITMDNWLPLDTVTARLHYILTTELIILKSEDVHDPNMLMNTVPKVLKYLMGTNADIKSIFQETTPQRVLESLDFPYCSIDILTAPGQTGLPVMQYPSTLLKRDAHYLFIGGTSGLGWELLQHCAEMGAGNFITLSRRLPSLDKIAWMNEVEKAHGCNITHVQGDVTDLESMKAIFSGLKQKRIEIKGIFHGGGVLKDATLENMTQEQLEIALLPKVLGTMNLHEVSKDLPLDFFVTHSSVAAVFGNQGQCNYAAGNSFQDSFAYFRRSLGYRAQTINWGALTMGMSTNSNIDLKSRFQRQGIHFLNARDVRKCFNEMMLTNDVQKIFGIFDWQRLYSNPNFSASKRKFEHMLDLSGIQKHADLSDSTEIQALPTDFLQQTPDKQKKLILDITSVALKNSLSVHIEDIGPNTSLYQLGIDSMSAMGVSNILFTVTNVRIPVVFLLSNSSTVQTVADFLLVEYTSSIQNENASSLSSAMPTSYDILNRSVSFIQENILKRIETLNATNHLIRIIDYELIGKTILVKDWRSILTNLMKLHHGLRQTFRRNSDTTMFEVIENDVTENDVPMTVRTFETIFEISELRQLDPRKDLPVLFHLACKGKKTRIKVFLHVIVGDMRCIEILFRDLETCARHHFLKTPLPPVNTVNIAEELQQALLPKFGDMKTFWKWVLRGNIEPFSYTSSVTGTLDEANWLETRKMFTETQFDYIINFVRRENITLYNFVLSIYFMLVHEFTGMMYVPLTTITNIRGFVPALENVLTRCVNEVPVIGTVDRSQKLKTYFQENALKLNEITENGAYPFQLIKEEMQSDELKMFIDRHEFVVDDISTLSKQESSKGVTVKISSILHRQRNYETCLYLYYDLARKLICLELSFDTKAISISDAKSMLNRSEILLTRCVCENSDITVGELLDESGRAVDLKSDNRTEIRLEQLFKNTHESSRDLLEKSSVATTNIPLDGIARKKDIDGIPKIVRGHVELQSTHGYLTKVELSLQRTESPEHFLQFKKRNSVKKISFRDITEIHIKKMTGRFAVFLKKDRKWVIFLAKDLSDAQMWFNAIEKALEQNLAVSADLAEVHL